MSIRLLGGFARNFEVKNERTSNLKPTLSQLKRKVFDRFQSLDGIHFIDLCSGTGSIGLEALSRGASHVSFIEKSKKNFINLNKNINNFKKKFSAKYTFEISSLNTSFEKYLELSEDFNLPKMYYFDPPFDEVSLYDQFFHLSSRLSGIILIEGDTQKTFPIETLLVKCTQAGFIEEKTYKSGSHYISYLEANPELNTQD